MQRSRHWKADRRRVRAFELWRSRWLLWIPQTAKITNKEILDRTSPKISIEAKIAKKTLSYLAMSCELTQVKNSITMGLINRKTIRSHPSTHWLDTMKDDTEMTTVEPKEAAWDRGAWKLLIHSVTEGWTWLTMTMIKEQKSIFFSNNWISAWLNEITFLWIPSLVLSRCQPVLFCFGKSDFFTQFAECSHLWH